jgi:acetyl esterase/lipase
MIYKTITRAELGANLPAGGDKVRLRAYLRPNKGLLADDGHRWAVIVCPGGGYWQLAPSESEPVALAFLAAGVQAFVLDYSLEPVRYPVSLMELASSVAWVRAHAQEYGIDPQRVAVCGFSAGGHLAGCASNLWGHPVLSPLGLTPEEMRPDASVLCYPVITTEARKGHLLSFSRLLGPDAPIPSELSLEQSVTDRTPPTFLWATVTDDTVPVENTMVYARALRAHNVPFELHLYGDGPHAMGLATPESAWSPEYENPHAATWHGLCVEWLRRLP